MKFHHIGIATNNINKTFEFVKNHFDIVNFTDIIYDKNQNAALQMIYTKDINIELVSGGMVKDIIKKKITYYHICYEVTNIQKSINSFENSILISPPKEAILFDNKKVAFLYTPIGLIELLEEK
jgi:methylmalonyl-CoA/ethylmalonyl-CoA epimerase